MEKFGVEKVPSPLEADVLYNATSLPDWGGFEIVKSREQIPELTWGEATDAAESLEKCLNGLFVANGVPEFDVFGNTRYGDDMARFSGWIEEEPIDRTVETPLIDPLIYTPGVVSHLQRTFLVDWPLCACGSFQCFPAARSRDRVRTI